jgi:hypothetical protein
MRTFSDSGNQFLHAFREGLDALQRFLAADLFFLGTLSLNLFLQLLHFLNPSKRTLHPITVLNYKSFSRAHPRVGFGLHPDGDEVIFAVTLILSRVVT